MIKLGGIIALFAFGFITINSCTKKADPGNTVIKYPYDNYTQNIVGKRLFHHYFVKNFSINNSQVRSNANDTTLTFAYTSYDIISINNEKYKFNNTTPDSCSVFGNHTNSDTSKVIIYHYISDKIFLVKYWQIDDSSQMTEIHQQ